VAVTPRSPSRTTILTAVARALHREETPPWVLDDHLALPLTGEEGPVLIEPLRAQLPGEMLRVFARWVCIRARVPEDMMGYLLSRAQRRPFWRRPAPCCRDGPR
jgi:O-methyltransferase involved in polyketide biosynthesis